MAEAGKVRTLACATAERLPELPDAPTFRQAGWTLSMIPGSG